MQACCKDRESLERWSNLPSLNGRNIRYREFRSGKLRLCQAKLGAHLSDIRPYSRSDCPSYICCFCGSHSSVSFLCYRIWGDCSLKKYSLNTRQAEKMSFIFLFLFSFPLAFFNLTHLFRFDYQNYFTIIPSTTYYN